MRVVYGLKSISFKKHESYDDMNSHIGDASQSIVLGEDAEVFVSFESLEIKCELGLTVTRVGIILEHDYTTPHIAIPPVGEYVAIGYNRNVAFLHGNPLAPRETRLDYSFYYFIVSEERLVAIHELGCVGFDIATCMRCWEVTTEVIENTLFRDGMLLIESDDGKCLRVNIDTGEYILVDRGNTGYQKSRE